MSDQICSNNVQRTYTVEQVSRILGISLRKTYYLCEHTTDFKVIILSSKFPVKWKLRSFFPCKWKKLI